MVWKKLLGGGGSRKSGDGDIDIEEYLNDLSVRDGRVIENEDMTYVKPIDLDSDGKGVGTVLAEIEKGNIVVLNVRGLMHNKVLLRNIVKELRDACTQIDGDLGRISEDKVLVLPAGMRIIQRSN
ncbi:MAG: cell division protein SepF [Candidatus Altiarchaeota archaeon]|nr:cell division protein SepF [Candidatus Altiarchaeota archaeon]